MFDEPTAVEEAQETMDELDAFEARLRDDAARGRPAAPPRASVVAPAKKPAVSGGAAGRKAGSEYVAAAVRSKQSEEEAEGEDARRAVADIDSFGGPDSP